MAAPKALTPPRSDGAQRQGGIAMSDPIVTATLTDTDLASLSGLGTPVAQPTPLHEFWRHFSANAGAVAGLVVVMVVNLLVDVTYGVINPRIRTPR